MDILDFKDLEDWRLKNECYPFEDSLGNLCITVESEHESFGGEKDARLDEARDYGIDRLIRFYGKTYVSEGVSLVAPVALEITKSQASIAPATPTKLYDAASTPDYFISQRSCVRMKVLVKIPKDTFDNYTANSAACDINKPAEGYLSAFISVENYERDIDYITTSMEDFLPKMAKADKYMTNINIVKEIKRLKQIKSVIGRYFNLNSVTATAIKEEACEADKQSEIEIGFSYDYKSVFALVDGNKHTIGYDCFLEASLLNHPTTANYLTQLGNMSSALTNQLSLDFDIFQFLVQYTYPTPVVEAKKNSLDGIEKYDANGNLFSFANLAKLITLDLDKKSCKLDGEKERERNVVFSDATKANIASTVRQSKEFVGNIIFSESEGWQDLKETGRTASYYSSDSSTSYFRGQRSVDKIYNDVLDKIDFNCVLEESLKCSLEAAITRLGEAAFDDPDLSEFFNADGVIELFGLCEPDNCKNQLQLKVGLPAFQGMTIPANFPTVDYLSKAMDAALKNLYDILINAIVSFITGIFELMCKAVSATEFAAIGSMFGDGFKSWLSKTIGVDVSLLTDGKAWADAALSAGGTGFMGEIGNLSAKVAGSWDALVQDTGISLNLPNPNTGMVEEVLISLDLIYQTMSGVQKATEDLEVILTSGELKSLYKGAAPDDVLDLAYGCLHRGNPDLFQSREDVSDLFSSLGEMVNGNFLEESATTPITVTNACGLDDGTNQDILARSNLTSKDPLLSDSEIEELLSKEKNRLIEKVKKLHKLLKAFQDGTLFPSFPSIFGSEDSLIPETPPIIADAMKTAIEGLYGSTINNFNFGATLYPALWDDIIPNETSEVSVNDPSQVSNNVKVLFGVNPENSEKIQYNIGYTFDGETLAEIVEIIKTKIVFGPYSYGADWDRKGEDEGVMKDFADELSKQTIFPDNQYFETEGENYATFSNAILKVSDEVEVNDKRLSDKTFTSEDLEIESTDIFPSGYTLPDNTTIQFIVVNNEGSGEFTVEYIETTHEGATDVVRSPDFTDSIVTVESDTDGSAKGILYTSADYTIGDSEASLGRTISTGMLKEHKVGTIDADLQDTQFEQLENVTYPTDSYKDDEVYKTIVEGMANSISNGKSSGSDLDALTYPTKDILGYSQITEESSELLSKLFPLSLSDDYCDKLSPLRRMGTISGLRLFIRTAIVESAMIAIQVFDVYGTDFIDDDVFVEIIKKKIKYNTSRYQKSFDALEGDLFSDMKDTALKYNEIQILLGSDIEEIDSGSQALEEMIKTEASLIKENISSALKLNWDYSSWDDFLEQKVFGLIEFNLPTLEGIDLSYKQYTDATTFEIPSDIITSPLDITQSASIIKFVKAETMSDNKFVYTYNISAATLTEGIESYRETIDVDGTDYTFTFPAQPGGILIGDEIVSFSCEQNNEPTVAEKEEIFMTLKTNLLESEEYKTLFGKTFPIKEIASSLVLYQESALSDDSVFYGEALDELNGKNLFDMLSETKLSTLQTFLASIHGAGETVYIDPFLEKLKT